MRLWTCLISFALVNLLDAAPSSDNDDLVITKDFYMDQFIKYRSRHDIIKIVVPINKLNFRQSDSSEEDEFIIFFVEADIQPDRTHQYKGLYVLKEGKATKILPNGRDAAATADERKLVFFGCDNGIYVYDYKTNSAEKYGPITDSIIAIEKEKTGDVLYILTENREVFKVSNNGEKKEKLNDVVNAKEIILDYSDNLYFFSDDNKPYVRTADGVKQIQGLPNVIENVKFIKAPFYFNNGVPFATDDKMYDLFANGTSKIGEIQIDRNAKPSSFAPEAALVQFYGFNKNIYELNMMTILMNAAKDSSEHDKISSYINSKTLNSKKSPFKH